MRAREKRRERERRGVRSRDGGRSRRFLCRGFVCLPRRASSMFLTAHNHQKYHHHIFDDSNLKSNRRVAAMSKVHFRQPLAQKSVIKVAFGCRPSSSRLPLFRAILTTTRRATRDASKAAQERCISKDVMMMMMMTMTTTMVSRRSTARKTHNFLGEYLIGAHKFFEISQV